ncbi:MAG: hypothetical protein JO055_13055 [Alphaproteobacteria bacterium]|nr:hypothetical protein [Alphaproteobacteria bacterium]
MQFNGCVMSSFNCTIIPVNFDITNLIPEYFTIGFTGDTLDDSSLVLVNQGNEELIDDRRRKRQRGAAGRTQ